MVRVPSSLRNNMTAQGRTDDGFLLDLVRRVVKDEGLSDDASIDVEALDQAGNGFVGVNSAIEIRDEKKVLKLFAKAAIKNEKVRDQMYAHVLFCREIYFYETLHPSFLKFQLDRNVKHPFDSVCRCYLTSTEKPHETLIFENLKDQGYVQYNKKTEMDDQTIKFVFKLYAQFHAVSYAMKDQEPELFEKLSENLSGILSSIFKSIGMDLVFASYSEEAKQFFDLVKDAYILKRIENLTEILIDFLSKTDEAVDHSVIVHGDCWFNNFLFKYKDPGDQKTLEGIKVLDWQVIRLSSPVLDLSYFFYGIATKATMAQLDLFLKIYHDALSENIREMGSDPEKLYPNAVFREHWKRFSKFGLFMSLAIQRMLLSETNEVPNPIESVDAGEKWGEAFMTGLRKNDAYEQRIRDIIEHFVQNDFI